MKRLSLLLLAAIALTSCAARERAESAAETQLPDNEFTRFCKTAPCRGRTVVELRKDDGASFRLELPIAPPIVQPRFVSLYAGESIILEADESQDGRLENLKAVLAVTHPDRTIQMHLFQDRAAPSETNMVLVVQNGFSKVLKYRLGILLPDDQGPPLAIRSTTTCPVSTGVPSYEGWPTAIYQILASDFRLVDAGSAAAGTCE